MDVKTGEIREFDSASELQKALATGHWEQIDKLPDPKCKKCYGRGYTGYDTVRKRYNICRCVKTQIPEPLDVSLVANLIAPMPEKKSIFKE